MKLRKLNWQTYIRINKTEKLSKSELDFIEEELKAENLELLETETEFIYRYWEINDKKIGVIMNLVDNILKNVWKIKNIVIK